MQKTLNLKLGGKKLIKDKSVIGFSDKSDISSQKLDFLDCIFVSDSIPIQNETFM